MASSRNNVSPDRVKDHVRSRLVRYFVAPSSSGSVCVGLSGGCDSVALLVVLHELQPEFGFKLSACHVNHGLSPHADDWQHGCSALCERFGISFKAVSVSVDIGASTGLENAARQARYAAFANLEADWLMLAQHRGDLAETLLFNLLRGSGVLGAAAMPECRAISARTRLMRPMLGISRIEIVSYLTHRQLTWVNDESNANERFSRNFLRRRIIPVLAERFPATESRLAAAANSFSEAHQLLNDLATTDLAGASDRFPLELSVLAHLSEPRARNVLRYMLYRQGVGIPTEDRLREALRQVLCAAPDRHPAINFGAWVLLRRGEQICLEKSIGDGVDIAIK